MNQHDVSVHASERMHPMDVIVRAVETEGIQELLNRLKKRDIQVLSLFYQLRLTHPAAFTRVCEL